MDVFKNNSDKYYADMALLSRLSNRIAVFRVVEFITFFTLTAYFANARSFEWFAVAGIVGIVGFALLIKWHNKVDEQKRFRTMLKSVNDNEIYRLQNLFSKFDPGQEFANADHPYTSDLDVFGNHSLFQLINRTETTSGRMLLGTWLSAPADTNAIHERQEAIKELTPKIAWRQNFQAIGMHFKVKNEQASTFLKWVGNPEKLPNKQRYLLLIIPLSILASLSLIFFFKEFVLKGNPFGAVPLVVSVIVNGFVLMRFRRLAESIVSQITGAKEILNANELMIRAIEGERWTATRLIELQAIFTSHKFSVSQKLGHLRKVFEVFQMRGSKRDFNHTFYTIFNNLWFLDFYFIYSIQKWRHSYGSYVYKWFDGVGEYEVLGSLAAFHYANPAYTFAELTSEYHILNFEAVGHPLIPGHRRISNNFTYDQEGRIAMITGSNMAGKSTFLRTIGVNVVLLLMGAPCCARHAKVSHVQLFSSMRTQDNLEEGVSSFYAELRRIEQLLKLINEGKRVFFLLDEMFKGTNSKDRHRGGYSLIKQLLRINPFGIISTHDLDLAIQADTHQFVSNYSFNSEIRDREIIFDYRLTPGLCRDFNASELMRRSGIDIQKDI